MLLELAIPGFVIVFFGVGCLGASIAAAIYPDVYSIQVAVFAIVSLVSLLTLRKVAVKIFVGRSEDTDSEDLGNIPLGSKVTLDQDLEPGQIGRVHFRGTMWDAVTEERIEAGSEAEIISVSEVNRSCLRIKPVSRNS